MSTIYKAPESDTRRLRTLKQTIAVAAQDALDGYTYVHPDVIVAATAVYAEFDTKIAVVSEKLSARIQLIEQKDAAIQLLEWNVRDAWEVTKRRVRRRGESDGVLVYYGLATDGIVPGSAPQQTWLDYGKTIINGDDEAAAAGFERLLCPNVAEVQAAFTAAESLFETVPSADRAYDMAQDAVGDLRPQVDEVLADVVRDMRYNISRAKMDKESERRIMRGYGFEFITRTSTPEEAVDEVLAGEEVVENG